MGRGFALHAGVAPEVIRAAARAAEAAGYDSFWVNYPGPVDGLASLALAAAETRRIALGVGVVPLHTRGPDSIATACPRERAARRAAPARSGKPEPRSPPRACAKAFAPCGLGSRRGSTSRPSGRACAGSLARSPTACSSTG